MSAEGRPQTHRFWLDWTTLVVEFGDVERYLRWARPVGATSWNEARRLREWHLNNVDQWAPYDAVRNEPMFEPNVSEIQPIDHRGPR